MQCKLNRSRENRSWCCLILEISYGTLSGQTIWKQRGVSPNALRVWWAASRLFIGRTGRGRAGMQNKVGFDQVGWRVVTDQLRCVLVVLRTQDQWHDTTTDVSSSTSATAAATVAHWGSARCKSFVCRAPFALVVVTQYSLGDGHYSRSQSKCFCTLEQI